ncbi:hypothetical protein FPY71_14985 [Aureimonas fodinaquatilis]|uniref:Uncharacterized protein n=2 Tax=Aureimonas fodinaquatilis TaxID=2565783 RepID=A0A5B0DR68_9HYPH|nr:hypothetical protein FPY71_14985 [Aureimonas fodinaquatilis]
MARSAFKTPLFEPEGRVVSFPCPTSARILAERPRLDDSQRVDLDRLRWLALRSRLAPKPNLEKACFLLAGEKSTSLDRFATCFFRGLESHARREMVFYRPGSAGVSDDEVWLVRLLDAWRQGDQRAAAALIAWRVQPSHQRWMRFLAEGLVGALN